MDRRIARTIAALAVVSLGAAACSDEDREDIGDAVDTVVDEVEDAGRTAVSEAEDAVGDAASDAAELAARNIATQQGEEQFADAGRPLDDGGLTCEATVADGLDGVDVNCTGTTQDGGAAELTGSTGEVPGASATELDGTFTGTVDGDEVFSAESLGG